MPSTVLCLLALLALTGPPGPGGFDDPSDPSALALVSPTGGQLVECPHHLHKPAEDATEVEEAEEDEQANVSHPDGGPGAFPIESALREISPSLPPHGALPRSPRGPPAPRV